MILTLATAATLSAQAPGITTLRELRDHARPLLIFAPRPDDPRLQIQLRTLREHAAEAHDRQLIPSALPYGGPQPTSPQLLPDKAESARRRFHVAPADFAVILIGKDGGSKLRSGKPISMDKLDTTIDAMPMGQDEMRNGAPGI